MEIIYIGTYFEVGYLQYPDGSRIGENVLTAMLYNRASGEHHQGTVTEVVEDDNTYSYHVEFPQHITGDMIPGVYDLEIYYDYPGVTQREMLLHLPNYGKAIIVTASAEEESSSES